jgi:hypothetical protein
MAYKNTLVPLSYMENFDDGDVKWNVQLPDYVDSDSISLNLSTLKRISRWAGLKRIEINSMHSVDQNEALASYNEFKGAESNIVIFEDDDEHNFIQSEYKWDYGLITINTTELYANVLRRTSEEESVVNPKKWSNHLNSTIKDSINVISKVQLTSGISVYGKINALSVLAIGGVIGLASGSFENVVPSILGVSMINQAASSIYHHGYGESIQSRRLSLLPSYQLDRLLVIKGILKYKDLVTVNQYEVTASESI